MGHPRHMGHTPKGDIRPLLPGVCPDCDSDAEMTRDDLGIWHLTIRHDRTCPTYSGRSA